MPSQISTLVNVYTCIDDMKTLIGDSTQFCARQETSTFKCPTQKAAEQAKIHCGVIPEYILPDSYEKTTNCLETLECPKYSTTACAIEYFSSTETSIGSQQAGNARKA